LRRSVEEFLGRERAELCGPDLEPRAMIDEEGRTMKELETQIMSEDAEMSGEAARAKARWIDRTLDREKKFFGEELRKAAAWNQGGLGPETVGNSMPSFLSGRNVNVIAGSHFMVPFVSDAMREQKITMGRVRSLLSERHGERGAGISKAIEESARTWAAEIAAAAEEEVDADTLELMAMLRMLDDPEVVELRPLLNMKPYYAFVTREELNKVLVLASSTDVQSDQQGLSVPVLVPQVRMMNGMPGEGQKVVSMKDIKSRTGVEESVRADLLGGAEKIKLRKDQKEVLHASNAAATVTLRMEGGRSVMKQRYFPALYSAFASGGALVKSGDVGTSTGWMAIGGPSAMELMECRERYDEIDRVDGKEPMKMMERITPKPFSNSALALARSKEICVAAQNRLRAQMSSTPDRTLMTSNKVSRKIKGPQTKIARNLKKMIRMLVGEQRPSLITSAELLERMNRMLGRDPGERVTIAMMLVAEQTMATIATIPQVISVRQVRDLIQASGAMSAESRRVIINERVARSEPKALEIAACILVAASSTLRDGMYKCEVDMEIARRWAEFKTRIQGKPGGMGKLLNTLTEGEVISASIEGKSDPIVVKYFQDLKDMTNRGTDVWIGGWKYRQVRLDIVCYQNSIGYARTLLRAPPKGATEVGIHMFEIYLSAEIGDAQNEVKIGKMLEWQAKVVVGRLEAKAKEKIEEGVDINYTVAYAARQYGEENRAPQRTIQAGDSVGVRVAIKENEGVLVAKAREIEPRENEGDSGPNGYRGGIMYNVAQRVEDDEDQKQVGTLFSPIQGRGLVDKLLQTTGVGIWTRFIERVQIGDEWVSYSFVCSAKANRMKMESQSARSADGASSFANTPETAIPWITRSEEGIPGKKKKEGGVGGLLSIMRFMSNGDARVAFQLMQMGLQVTVDKDNSGQGSFRKASLIEISGLAARLGGQPAVDAFMGDGRLDKDRNWVSYFSENVTCEFAAVTEDGMLGVKPVMDRDREWLEVKPGSDGTTFTIRVEGTEGFGRPGESREVIARAAEKASSRVKSLLCPTDHVVEVVLSVPERHYENGRLTMRGNIAINRLLMTSRLVKSASETIPRIDENTDARLVEAAPPEPGSKVDFSERRLLELIGSGADGGLKLYRGETFITVHVGGFADLQEFIPEEVRADVRGRFVTDSGEGGMMSPAEAAGLLRKLGVASSEDMVSDWMKSNGDGGQMDVESFLSLYGKLAGPYERIRGEIAYGAIDGVQLVTVRPKMWSSTVKVTDPRAGGGATQYLEFSSTEENVGEIRYKRHLRLAGEHVHIMSEPDEGEAPEVRYIMNGPMLEMPGRYLQVSDLIAASDVRLTSRVQGAVDYGRGVDDGNLRPGSESSGQDEQSLQDYEVQGRRQTAEAGAEAEQQEGSDDAKAFTAELLRQAAAARAIAASEAGNDGSRRDDELEGDDFPDW
jgi:hypothetical protein